MLHKIVSGIFSQFFKIISSGSLNSESNSNFLKGKNLVLEFCSLEAKKNEI